MVCFSTVFSTYKKNRQIAPTFFWAVNSGLLYIWIVCITMAYIRLTVRWFWIDYLKRADIVYTIWQCSIIDLVGFELCKSNGKKIALAWYMFYTSQLIYPANDLKSIYKTTIDGLEYYMPTSSSGRAKRLLTKEYKTYSFGLSLSRKTGCFCLSDFESKNCRSS